MRSTMHDARTTGRARRMAVRIRTGTAWLAWRCWPRFRCATSPRAAELPDLYEAEVPVSSQESGDRESALGLALRRVLHEGDRATQRRPPRAARGGTEGAPALRAAVPVPKRPRRGVRKRAKRNHVQAVGEVRRRAGRRSAARIRPEGVGTLASFDPGVALGRKRRGEGPARRGGRKPILPLHRGGVRNGAAFRWYCRFSTSRIGSR